MLFKREEENNWRCFFPLCKSNFLNFSKEKTSIELKTPNTFKWFYFSFAYKSSLFFNTSTYLHSSYNLNFYYDFFFAIKLSETAILMNSSPGPSSVRNVVWDDSFHFSCFQALMYDVFGMMKYDYVTISMVISRVLNVFGVSLLFWRYIDAKKMLEAFWSFWHAIDREFPHENISFVMIHLGTFEQINRQNKCNFFWISICWK